MSFIPRNSYMAIWSYLSTEDKPIDRLEFDEFWDSCTLEEKHDFMCADLGEFNSNVKKAALNLHDTARELRQDEFEQWYYGLEHKPWCEDVLPPHVHTKRGLMPMIKREDNYLANPYHDLLRDRDKAQYEKERAQKFLGLRPQIQIFDEIQQMPEFSENRPLRHDGWYYGKDVGLDDWTPELPGDSETD